MNLTSKNAHESIVSPLSRAKNDLSSTKNFFVKSSNCLGVWQVGKCRHIFLWSNVRVYLRLKI